MCNHASSLRNKERIEYIFSQIIKGRGLCPFLQLESNGDFLLYRDRVLEVNYNQVDKFVNCSRNCFSFLDELAKNGENESHKRSAAGINS